MGKLSEALVALKGKDVVNVRKLDFRSRFYRGAVEWSFSRMSSKMDFEIRQLAKAFHADVTFVVNFSILLLQHIRQCFMSATRWISFALRRTTQRRHITDWARAPLVLVVLLVVLNIAFCGTFRAWFRIKNGQQLVAWKGGNTGNQGITRVDKSSA